MRYLLIMALFAINHPVAAQTSLYSISIDSLGGQKTINLSAFQGKKILFVNTASGDSASSQYAQLKQLQNRYKDSLVIIALPSNSFGSESASQASLQTFYNQETTNRFPVSQTLSVKGTDTHPLYQWLTQQAKNGVMDSEVRRPFQKYLVSESGQLLGVFSGKMSPLDAPLIRAITSTR